VLHATKTTFGKLGAEDSGWMDRLVGFGADGAAVNMGCRGGVIALLKEEVGEHVIPLHCMPHRHTLDSTCRASIACSSQTR
ncbi:hypothetical protein CHARACLAT_018103, partial [Characodon lateralis]|nr:hypothetical protein [Characodon lateralis]